MLTPSQKYEVCRVKSEMAYFPVINASDNIFFYVSTRNGSIVIDKNDGSPTINYNPLKYNDLNDSAVGYHILNYPTDFSGEFKVKFMAGLRDVYAFRTSYLGQSSPWNIQDLESFLNQFPKLEFLTISENLRIGGGSIIKGDLSKVPDTVKKITVENSSIDSTYFFLNFNNFKATSKLEYFRKFNDYTFKILGNLSNLPVTCKYFSVINPTANSSITYTAGKVWASAFDTLSIPLPLTHTELDSLLADMDNSINTKIGEGVISIGGYRSVASDAHVASLQTKGFTVNIQRFLNDVSNSDSAILRLDFQNNFDVYSNSGMNIGTGGTSNPPTFALSGRKAGEYCAVFNGSQSIKTTTNLPVNSDKVTIAFWMKTDSSAASIITELSADINSNNAFNVYTNVGNVKNLNVTSRVTALNQSRIDNNSLHGNIWNHVSVVIDRTQNAANEILIYVNGVLATFTKPASTDNNGNFVNNILFIGQRGGSSLGFNGSLTKLKIYNYPFTSTEVSNLYNSEL